RRAAAPPLLRAHPAPEPDPGAEPGSGPCTGGRAAGQPDPPLLAGELALFGAGPDRAPPGDLARDQRGQHGIERIVVGGAQRPVPVPVQTGQTRGERADQRGPRRRVPRPLVAAVGEPPAAQRRGRVDLTERPRAVPRAVEGGAREPTRGPTSPWHTASGPLLYA